MPVATTSFDNVLVERQGAVARLVINRSPALNILDIETLRELKSKLENLQADAGVRMIEIRGDKTVFSAGADIREHLPDRAPEMLREFHRLIRSVLYGRLPTLAIVRGHCLGAGMELALACDFVLASTDARFGQPEIRLGAFPPVAAVLLPRLIPEKKALEIILTGEAIPAQEAHRLGLVNRVAESFALDVEVEKFGASLLTHSSRVLALARKATRLGSRENFESALRESERIYLEELLTTQDAQEGVRAYLEKRPPVWKEK